MIIDFNNFKKINENLSNEKIDTYIDNLEDLYNIMEYLLKNNDIDEAINTYKSIIELNDKTEPYLESFNEQQTIRYNSLQIRFKKYIDKIEKLIN